VNFLLNLKPILLHCLLRHEIKPVWGPTTATVTQRASTAKAVGGNDSTLDYRH